MSITINAIKKLVVHNDRGCDAMASVTVAYTTADHKEFEASFTVTHSRVTGYVRLISGEHYSHPFFEEDGGVVKFKTKKQFVQWVGTALQDPETFTLPVNTWVESSSDRIRAVKRAIQSTALTVFSNDTYVLLHDLMEEFKSLRNFAPQGQFKMKALEEHLNSLINRNIGNHCTQVASDSVVEGQIVYHDGRSGTVEQVSTGGTWVRFHNHTHLTAMMPTEKWYTQKPSSVVCTVQALLLGVSSRKVNDVVTEDTLDFFNMVVREMPVEFCYFGQVFGHKGSVYYASGEVNATCEGYVEVTHLKTRQSSYMPVGRKVFAL